MPQKLLSLAAIMACSLLAQSPLRATPDVLVAEQSATVSQEHPDEGVDPTLPLEARNLSWHPAPQYQKVVKVPLIQFDLSDFPENTNFKSAKIRLKVYDPDNTNRTRPPIRFSPIREEWHSGNVTWSTRPEWDEAYAECRYDQDSQPDQEYEEYDVTPLVRKWIDGSIENHGLAILAEPEHGMWSQIMYGPDPKPTLEIEY